MVPFFSSLQHTTRGAKLHGHRPGRWQHPHSCPLYHLEGGVYNPSTWSCGVVVITSASHAEGRRFDPGQDLRFCPLFCFRSTQFVCPYFRIASCLWRSRWDKCCRELPFP